MPLFSHNIFMQKAGFLMKWLRCCFILFEKKSTENVFNIHVHINFVMHYDFKLAICNKHNFNSYHITKPAKITRDSRTACNWHQPSAIKICQYEEALSPWSSLEAHELFSFCHVVSDLANWRGVQLPR